MVVSAGRSVS